MRSGMNDAIVVGAGVFGAWTALHLRRTGRRVLLLDRMVPAITARVPVVNRGSFG